MRSCITTEASRNQGLDNVDTSAGSLDRWCKINETVAIAHRQSRKHDGDFTINTIPDPVIQIENQLQN